MDNNLGITLRNLRESNGYKQYEISNYLNISNQAYSNYEIGIRTPDTVSLAKIAKFYNIDIGILIATLIPEDFSDIPRYSNDHSEFDLYKTLSNEEFEMILLFRQLNQRDKEDIMDFSKLKIHKYKQDINNKKRF